MISYEEDRKEFDARLANPESCRHYVIMCVSLHGFSRHTEGGSFTDGIFAIAQFGRAVRQGIATIYGIDEPANVSFFYSAYRAMISFPESDAARVVTCATAIFREIEEINRARADLALPATNLLCKAGIASGNAIANLHAHTSATQDLVGEPVDIAYQLANIARKWQILVEQRYYLLVRDMDLSTVGGEIGVFKPRPGLDKRVKGYKDLVKVSAFVWDGGKASSRIQNAPFLQSDLKVLAVFITEFLQHETYFETMARNDLDAGVVDQVKDGVERLNASTRTGKPDRWQGALFLIDKLYQESSEASQEREIQRHFQSLRQAYNQLIQTLNLQATIIPEQKIDPVAWQEGAEQCIWKMFCMFQEARGLLIAVSALLQENE